MKIKVLNIRKNSTKELEKPIETSTKLNGDHGSRANSPVLNKKSPLLSSVSGRRGSISTTLSSVGGGDNNLQREEIWDQTQPERPAKKERNTQENEKSEPTKQPNNRNFRIALATYCTLSVGCLVAGVVTLGMVGAGLLVMSIVFAMAAVVTRYLPPPLNELTSTDLSPLIDESKQR